MSTHKRRTQERFGERADLYVTSGTHGTGNDLEIVRGLCAARPGLRALDVATGGGHTARVVARDGAWTIATDLTPDMLRAARAALREAGVTAPVSAADAEALPFRDGTFDLVTCRVAPHHFQAPAAFVREAARVLRPGGAFVLEDHEGQDDPAHAAWIEAIERERDPTHVQAYTRAQWCAWCQAAGLVVEHTETYVRVHDLADWCSRQKMPPDAVAALRARFDAAPADVSAALRFEREAGRVVRWGNDMLILRARRPAPAG